MKKILRLALALAACCWLGMNLISCSKDDDSTKQNQAPQLFNDKQIESITADVSRIYTKDDLGNIIVTDTLISDTVYYKYDKYRRIIGLYGEHQRGAFDINQEEKKIFLSGDYLESDFTITKDNFFKSMSLFWDILVAKGDFEMTMEYNDDNHLVAINFEERTVISTSSYEDKARLDYTWEDGKLMEVSVTYIKNVILNDTVYFNQYIADCKYIYTSQTENKWKQWSYFTSASMSLFDFSSFAMPGCFGVGPSMLPDAFVGTVDMASQQGDEPMERSTLSIESKCQYTFNEDGTLKTETISKLPYAVANEETESVNWLVTDEKVKYNYE